MRRSPHFQRKSGLAGGVGCMKRSSGDGVKRYRSRPGRSPEGTSGAASAAAIPAMSRMTATLQKRPIIAFAPKAELSPRMAAVSAVMLASCSERRASTRDDLDLAVNAVDDAELAFVGLVIVASDGAILALRQDHAREGADRFLDHVAPGRQHRPLRVGPGLAAALAHELERDDGSAVIDRCVSELADLDADVGAHGRVGIAVVRNDVIRALRQQHDVAG